MTTRATIDASAAAAAADAAYLAALRRLTPSQRLTVAQGLRATAWQLKAAGLRARHPDWSGDEVERRVREIFLYASG